MRIEFLEAGHCSAFEALACKGAPWRMGKFAAGFACITMEDKKVLLFDTGYSLRVVEAMRRFPFSLYGKLLPVSISCEEQAAEQLAARNIKADMVSTIIISHFHPDHIGGLRDFPHTRFICSRKAWESVQGLSGFRALQHGFLSELLPKDFMQRVTFAETLPDWNSNDGWGGWAFNEHIRLVPLDGHAPGQLGLWIESEKVFLIADAVWRKSSLEKGALPHTLAIHVHHDRNAYRNTLSRLTELHHSRPDLRMVPTTYGAGE